MKVLGKEVGKTINFPSLYKKIKEKIRSIFKIGKRSLLSLPSIHLSDEDTAFKFYPELPGLSREDVNIEIKGNTMIVCGTKEHSERYSGLSGVGTKWMQSSFIRNIVFLMVLFLSLSSCKGQEKKEDAIAKEELKKEVEQPKGTWKVDKEFDENGNLIRYDSIYSWSSDEALNNLSTLDKDSLLNNFESKFYRSFSQFKNQGFEDVFEPDSLFTKHFFDDNFFDSDFGMDLMELDKIQKRMLERKKSFWKNTVPI